MPNFVVSAVGRTAKLWQSPGHASAWRLVDVIAAAAEQFKRADMNLYLAVTRRRAGKLRNDESGRDLLRQADDWMAQQTMGADANARPRVRRLSGTSLTGPPGHGRERDVRCQRPMAVREQSGSRYRPDA
jgi:hypothetical protein